MVMTKLSSWMKRIVDSIRRNISRLRQMLGTTFAENREDRFISFDKLAVYLLILPADSFRRIHISIFTLYVHPRIEEAGKKKRRPPKPLP